VTGSVSGTVVDPSGAVIAGAAVAITNNGTGATQTTKAGANGEFLFPLLKPGTYTVSATQQGFQTTQQTLTVRVGQTTTTSIQMPLGSGTTTVEVTGGVTPLQTQDANISTNFDTTAVQNIPNPGNDLTYVANTAPGVTMNTSSGMGYGNFSAFGLPGTSNLFTVNGTDYNDAFLNINNSGASNLLLGTNDVQEVSVVENGYTGQYGRMAGAQVNYTTLAGSNAFHGNAIYYWTGRALDANEWFQKASGLGRPFQNNNQWAANFGGPIKRNKAFFFLDTEGIRYIFGTSSSVFLPTPAFQSFVLSQPGIAGSASSTAFYNKAFSLYNATPGIANAVPVPDSCASATSIVPAGLASAGCLEKFGTSASAGNREWMVVGRVDINLSDSDKLFGQARFDRGFQPTYADPINPAFDAASNQPQDDGQLNWTHIFGSSAVNNFMFNELYYSAIFESVNQSAATATFPVIMCSSDTSMACLGPVGGEYPLGFFFPQGRNVEQWGLVDDFSLTRGNHNLKFGVNWRRNDISDFSASELTLNPAISSTLLGFATNTADVNTTQHFSVSPEQPLALYTLGAYAQDQWRVKPSLTVTATLRIDRNSPGACLSNCASRTAVPFTQLDHNSALPYNQMVVSGFHQILPNIQAVVWQPRLGFAWSPANKGFVVRGGVGLFSDLYPGLLLGNFTTNFPQVNAWSVPGGTISPGPGSGATLVAACNAAFIQNYKTGGNLPSYLGSAPSACTATSNGFPSVPQLFSSNQNIKNPVYAEWNLEVQKSIGPKGVFAINYVGNHGYDGFVINPYVNGFCGAACVSATGFTGSGLPSVPPDQRVGTTQQLTNAGLSNYNGVTVSYKQQMWHELTAGVNYTYSHSLDVLSNGGLLPFSIQNSLGTQINPFNLRANYANSDYDLRHQASLFYVWTIPGPKSGWGERVLGGWQVSGTAFWNSGFPFSMLDSATALGMAGNNLAFDGIPSASVLLQPNVSLPTKFGRSCAEQYARSISPNPAVAATAAACFSASDFAPSTTYIGGRYGRNFFRGPQYFNTDFSLRKSIKLTERYSFQIGANAFNVLNHANFATPQSSNLNGNFGFITGAVLPPTTPYGAFAAAAEDMRIVQVMGKFVF
jgi:outer membrane receptor protein involved in Fe transport